MGLKLDFIIKESQDSKSLTFQENTGIYGNTNLGGYGNPNPELGDITKATLTISGPDIVNQPLSIDIYNIISPNGFPTLDAPSQPYILDTTVLSNTTSPLEMLDGLYTFIYEVYDSVGDNYYHTTKNILFLNSVTCCVQKMFMKTAKSGCCDGCENEDMKKAILGFTLLETLLALECCGSIANINGTLRTLQNLCKQSKCGCH